MGNFALQHWMATISPVDSFDEIHSVCGGPPLPNEWLHVKDEYDEADGNPVCASILVRTLR